MNGPDKCHVPKTLPSSAFQAVNAAVVGHDPASKPTPGSSQDHSSVKPSYVLNSLSSDRLANLHPDGNDVTRLKTTTKSTTYHPNFTKSDESGSFQLPTPTTQEAGARVVLESRYVVDGVLSTEGVTSVVLECRDTFKPCKLGVRTSSSSLADQCSVCRIQ